MGDSILIPSYVIFCVSYEINRSVRGSFKCEFKTVCDVWMGDPQWHGNDTTHSHCQYADLLSYWSCGNSSHAAAAFVLALPKVWGWLLRLSTCATLPTRGGYNKRLWLWIIIKQARQSLNLWINSFYDFRVSPHCINKWLCLATYSPFTRRDHWHTVEVVGVVSWMAKESSQMNRNECSNCCAKYLNLQQLMERRPLANSFGMATCSGDGILLEWLNDRGRRLRWSARTAVYHHLKGTNDQK